RGARGERRRVMSARYSERSGYCASCNILGASHASAHDACDLIVYVEAFGECVDVRYFYVAPDRGMPASGERYCRSGAAAVRFVAELVDGSYRNIEHVGRVSIRGVNSAADAIVHAAT